MPAEITSKDVNIIDRLKNIKVIILIKNRKMYKFTHLVINHP
jgi:hypothetical protein